MQISGAPVKIVLPWGSGAGSSYITRNVPVPSQIGVTNFAASFTDGFPPSTMAPGGWPLGPDANGVLYMLSNWANWQSAGGTVRFDASFASAVGGYPSGALVQATSVQDAFWLNTVDGNSANPDTSPLVDGVAAGWVLCIIGLRDLDQKYLRKPPMTDFYVSPGGNDSNPGTQALPFASPTGAVTYVNQFATIGAVNIHVADGTYYGFSLTNSAIATWNWIGNNNNPANVILTASSSTPAINGGRAIRLAGNFNVNLFGMSLNSWNENIGAATGVNVAAKDMHLTAPSSGATGALTTLTGSYLLLYGTCTFQGNGYALASMNNSQVQFGLSSATMLDLSLIGTPDFSGACVVANALSIMTTNTAWLAGGVITGAATGKRYAGDTGSQILTAGGGANVFPGNIAGTTAHGAFYV